MVVNDMDEEKVIDVDNKFGERTIITRIHNIAEALSEREARGITIPEIAREILNRQKSTPTLTIDVAVYKASEKGRTGYIKQDGWVVIHPLPDDDDDAEEGELTWHSDLEVAQNTLREAWGEVDEELLTHLLQPAIVNVPTSDDEWDVGADNLAGTLRKLQEFAQSNLLNDTIFPRNYPNKKAFEMEIMACQEKQLEELNRVINTPDLVATNSEGVLHLRPESEWKMMGAHKPAYPVLPTVKGVRLTPDINVQRLLFIEDYLFGQISEPILYTLARAHTKLGPAMGSPGKREALNNEGNLGATAGTPLPELIESMAEDGFDLQPIFENNRCVGSLRLNDVVMSLQKYGAQALPSKVDIAEMKKIGLLSPAPPVVDAHEPLVKVAEWLSSGLEAVLVYYSPKLWENDGEHGAEIDKRLVEGWHIITQHDIVARSMMLRTSIHDDGRHDA